MPQILIGQIDVRQRSQSQPNSRKPEVEKTRKTQSYTDDSHTKGKQALRCQFPQLPVPMAKKEWVNGNVSPGILTAAHKNSDFVCLRVRAKTGNDARQICSKS